MRIEPKGGNPPVRARVLISGLVQGVFFRDFTRREALRRGVTGWVRNLPDGRVEAVLEGDREAVEAVVEACRRGPPLARVARVEVAWEEWKGEFKGFGIRWR